MVGVLTRFRGTRYAVRRDGRSDPTEGTATMTETQTAAEQTAETETMPATVTMPAATLRDILAGALVSAAKERDNTPFLATVRLTWDETGVTADSTDRFRYTRGFQPAKTAGTASVHDTVTTRSWSALIERADVAALVKQLPKPKRSFQDPEPVWLTATDDGLTVRMADWSRTLRTQPAASFPRIDQLWPNTFAGMDADTPVGVNPQRIADLAKIPTDPRAPWSVRFNGPHKPFVATNRLDAVEWTQLQMPVKLSD